MADGGFTGTQARAVKIPRHSVLLVGDSGVGKSSIVARLINPKEPLSEVKPTVGVDHRNVDIQCEDGPIALVLCDPSGSEQFARLLRTYLKDATFVVVVCDVTCPKSFNSVPTWIESVQKSNKDAMICVLANKFDSKDCVMTTEDVAMLKKSTDMTNVVFIADCSVKAQSRLQSLFGTIARTAAGLEEKRSSPQLLLSHSPHNFGCCGVKPARRWEMSPGCAYRPAKKQMIPSVFDEL